MSRRCQLTATKTRGRACKVSHSHRRTPKKLYPNLQSKSLASSLLGKIIKVRLAAKALRTVDRHGGIDQTIINTNDKFLSKGMLKVKKTLLALSKKQTKPFVAETPLDFMAK